MRKKTRFIILCICALLFLIFAPYIVLYSLGYRVDFRHLKLTATGGIYTRAFPQPTDVIIDSKIDTRPGILYNSVFVQNLLPGQHTVTVKKDGYYSYEKNINVKEKEVTKLENIILIKQNIAFTPVEKTIDNFYISPDNRLFIVKTQDKKTYFETLSAENSQNQTFTFPTITGKIVNLIWSKDSSKVLVNTKDNYFLLEPFLEKPKATPLPLLSGGISAVFDPMDSNAIFFTKNKSIYRISLDSDTLELPLQKNVATFQPNSDSNFIWLSYDGFLYHSDSAIGKITSQPFPIKKNGTYTLVTNSNITLLREDEHLFLLNKESQIFEDFYSINKDVKISPNAEKILYYNNHEVSILDLSTDKPEKILLHKFSETITDCSWLNNDYLLINLGSKIAISETDNRGNVNIIYLPENLPLTDETILNIKNAKIFFDSSSKKLYILSESNLAISEKLIP